MTTETRTRRVVYRMAGLLALGLLACGTETSDDRPLPDRLRSINTDLTVGSNGDDVRAVHEYLGKYGYFPDAKLAQEYPRWKPAVSEPPADVTVFDERTAEALRSLQRNAGLAQTGMVDEPTRALLTKARCGVPDGVVDLDPTDKFALLGNITSNTLSHKWSLVGAMDDGLSTDQVAAAVNAAATSWVNQSSLSIIQSASPGARTNISFADLGNTGTLGVTNGGGSNSSTIRLNIQFAWSVAASPPSGFVDLETVVLHELGHVLGLDHSALNQATMFPFLGSIDRTTNPDDNVGISTLWDTYEQLPGLAIDIGAGADGSVWVLGTDSRPYKWNGSNWDNEPTGIAVRIAVDPSGVPWVVTAGNAIFRHTTNSPFTGFWQQMPGAALDIGIGANGDVWVVGTGGGAFKFNFSSGIWEGVVATAKRIAVSPSGNPWIVTTTNGIQRRSTNSPFTGTWEAITAPAEDIGAGPGNSGPQRGFDGVTMKTDRGSILVWDEQTGFTSGNTGAPSTARWRIAGDNRGLDFALPQGPTAVSIGPNGRAWVIGTNGTIYRAVR
jgi:peptidoglycan hydrolase-like protein with peptidoglycan-binding domain